MRDRQDSIHTFLNSFKNAILRTILKINFALREHFAKKDFALREHFVKINFALREHFYLKIFAYVKKRGDSKIALQ